MHQPHHSLTPTGYSTLYQSCINTGWTEQQLDNQLAAAERNARSAGYIAATLRTLRHEGAPVVVVEDSTTTTTRTETIWTTNIATLPTRRAINPHPYQDDGDGYSCARCQLPAPNRVHQAD